MTHTPQERPVSRPLCLALLGWSLLAPAAGGQGVVEVLREVGSPAAASEALAQLAQADLGEVFDVLASGSLPLANVAEDAPLGTMRATALTADQRGCLLATLGATPSHELRRFLHGHVTPDAPRGARRAALELLAPIAGAADLDFAISLVQGQTRRTGEAFEQVVASMLARDHRALERVRHALSTDDERLRRGLIQGVGASDARAALPLLVSLLFADDPHLELLLEQVARIARRDPSRPDERTIDAVRPFLAADGAGVVAAAADAVTALGDTAAIPDLIALLEYEASTVRAAAKGALVQLTGLHFTTPRRWFLWYEAERDWWDTRWPTLAPALRNADRESITSLLAETIGKRLERQWLAAEIVLLLDHADPLVRRLACQSLGQLGAPSATPALVGAMSDLDETVARSAWSALVAITGRDLPNNPSEVSQILDVAKDR